MGLTQLQYCGFGLFSRVKLPEFGFEHPPMLKKERSKYLYSPSGLHGLF
jgi:hypothetical protein